MNRWRYNRDCDTTPPYVPPPEACLLLRYDDRGIIRPIERLPTPVDENGIPNPYETLRLLASTLDADYELPIHTNVHHQVHYRTEYLEMPERQYRESPSLMMNMSVQMHNLNHVVLERAPKPDKATMEQYVTEQQGVSLLFRLGCAALSSERAANNIEDALSDAGRSDLESMIEKMNQLRRRSNTKRKLAEKVLSKQMTGRLGLMPDPIELQQMGLADATTYLGKIGGGDFLDFRRTSQDFISRYGIKQRSAGVRSTDLGSRTAA